MEVDLDFLGEYIDEVSSNIWNITKRNGVCYVEDSLEGNTKIFYYGNGVFKSAGKEKTYAFVQKNKQIIKLSNV